MQKQFFDALNKAGETAYEAAKEVAAVNAATLEGLVEKQFEFANQAVEMGVKQLKLATEVKDVRTAVEAQVALAEEAAETTLENARDVVALANKARGAYDKLFDKGYKAAVAELKVKAPKKAA